MRSKTAWRAWQADRAPDAGTVLERRYEYLGQGVAEALEVFTGRPGTFADFLARRRSAEPPEPTVAPLAIAELARHLAPRYPAQPRLYSPPPVEQPKPQAPQKHVEEEQRAALKQETEDPVRAILHQQVEAPEDALNVAQVVDNLCPMGHTLPENERQTRPLTPLRDEAGHMDPDLQPTSCRPAAKPSAKVPAVPSSRPPARVQQVAEVETLAYFRDALSTVHRIVRPDAGRPEVDHILLEVGDGLVKIMGRDWSRCHLAAVPARTEGEAAVAIPRQAIAMGLWSQPGRLAIYEEWASFTPRNGMPVWVPAVPAVLPILDEAPGVAGIAVHRADLEEAIREAVGGSLIAGSLPDEVRLVMSGDRLVIEAHGRGTVRLPVSYSAGDLDVRISPRWITSAVDCCPADEVVLESLGRFAPVRVVSGWFSAIMATRTEESLL